MKPRNAVLSICAALGTLPALAQTPVGSEFTYQARLDLNGEPLNGTADFQFKLFTAAQGGAQVGATQAVNNVGVAAGLVTAELDFGAAAFNGDERFLEIAVRSPAGGGQFQTLAPRQPLTGAPYALKVPGVDGHSLDASDGSPVDAVFVDNAGNVGVGTTAPASRLHVNGGFLWGGETTNFARSDEDALGLFLEQQGTSAATSKIRLQTSKSGDLINYSQFFIDPIAGFSFMSLGTGNSNVGIGTTTPNGGLHVKREPITNGGTLTLEGTTHSYVAFFPDGAGAGRKGFFGFPGPAINDIHLANEIAGANIILTPGLGGVTRTTVLEITGADLAERFPTSEPADSVEPGTVMAIDPAHPGKLCVARGAYNRCVAGIVSGANDLSVGAVLGNLPGHEDAPPIALSGRVYVRCDATSAAIEPGDLLTTSDTPGHAMKAADRDRDHGAVIGKAMTSLARGESGMVLVLVSLH